MVVVRAVTGIAIGGPRMERERVAVPAIVFGRHQLAVMVVEGMAFGACHRSGVKFLIVAVGAGPLDSIEVVRALSRVAPEAVAARFLAGMALETPCKFGRGHSGGRVVDRGAMAAGTRGTSGMLGLRAVAKQAIRNPYLRIMLCRSVFDAVESDMAIDAIEPVVRLQRVASRALERRGGIGRMFRRVADEAVYLLRSMQVLARMAGRAGGKVYLGEGIEDTRLAGVRVVSGHRVTTLAARRKAVRVAVACRTERDRPVAFIAAFRECVDVAVLLDMAIPAEFGRAGGAGMASFKAAAGQVGLWRLVAIGASEPVGMDVTSRAVTVRVDTPLRQRGCLLRRPEEPRRGQ